MDDSGFPLHPRLAADCHVLGALSASTLLLHRNARLHWFICVPPTACIDLLDLAPEPLGRLLADATAVARHLKDALGYPRVNVGALGLVVPQLHLHVVGRRESDECWPKPVWGNLSACDSTYDDETLDRLRRALGAR